MGFRPIREVPAKRKVRASSGRRIITLAMERFPIEIVVLACVFVILLAAFIGIIVIVFFRR
jgi:hypothetical protein